MKLSEWLRQEEIAQAAFAAKVGVTQFAVSKWCRGGGVDPVRVREIVRATDGAVSAHELCPELYPPGFEFPPERASTSEAASA